MNNMIEEYLVDRTLADKIYRIQQHIEDSLKQNGDISQFKEDVMYVMHFLLERVDTKQLTATELQAKNMEYSINKMRKEKDEEYIEMLKYELEQKDKLIDKMKKRVVLTEKEHRMILKMLERFPNRSYEDCTLEYFKKESEKGEQS